MQSNSARSIVKIMLPLAIFLLALSLVSPVFADGGSHLWFYSQDPDTIPGPQPLPNPQDYDPNWIGSTGDPWVDESIVPPTDPGTPYTIYLGCKKFESLGTTLVVSINDVAAAALGTIKINGNVIENWIVVGMPAELSPHGVFNSAEFYGYALVPLGDLYSPPDARYKVSIVVEIDLESHAGDAKIHFDAYGHTVGGSLMKNPYSHDLTFVVPEPATIFMTLTSVSALGIYAYKRRKTP
jgi:hypothetical protein